MGLSYDVEEKIKEIIRKKENNENNQKNEKLE